MQHVFKETYSLIIELETSLLTYFRINPFDFGDLPLIDFNLYYHKVINMIDEMGEEFGDKIKSPQQLMGII